MKKVLLSIAAVMVASAAFAQAFTDGDTGYTESFGSSGTSCLKNFSNGGYQYADGNISSASNDANSITITAVASVQTGLAPGLFDFYYTDGSNNCSPMRPANIGADLTDANNAKITVRAKASINGATIQFHIASAPNSYPTATTASLGVPTAQTQITLTDTYTDYTINYNGSVWAGASAAVRGKINMWGALIPGDNVLNNSAVYSIEYIELGDNAGVVTSTTASSAVNEQVNLFPNPAKGSFNVDMTAMNNTEAASVKVLNANGTVVKTITSNSAVESISTDGLIKGIYMVQITSGNKVATKKVSVE